MKYYFAVDVETTGEHLSRNAMVAFGCSIMNEQMIEVDSFAAFMTVPDDRSWDARCVDEFWSKNMGTLEFIKERMQDPKKEMIRFATWLDGMDLIYGSGLIVLSDTSGYDYAWINLYLSTFTERPPIYRRLKSIDGEKRDYQYRRIWDSNSAYHGALTERRPDEYIEWGLEVELGCQNGLWVNDHNPLNDARNIACNYILYRQQARKRKRIKE